MLFPLFDKIFLRNFVSDLKYFGIKLGDFALKLCLSFEFVFGKVLFTSPKELKELFNFLTIKTFYKNFQNNTQFT